jgi:cobalamin biosynthesis Mg chelatase CobN
VPSDPSVDAFVKAMVKDAASQTGDDASNGAFTIYKPPILPADIAYVSIDPHAHVTLYVGDTQSFAAKAFDTKGKEMTTASIAWTVTGGMGNLSQASGASSTFTAITAGSGNVKVTATYNSKSVENTTSVTVLKVGTPTLAKVEIVPSSITGNPDKTFTLTAKATDSNGTDITDSTEFTWGVGALEVVQLSSTTGKSVTLTLSSVGETTISLTGKYLGVSKGASASVKVTKPQTEFPWWIIDLIIVVMIIVVILMALLGRRRKKKKNVPYDWQYPY